MKQHILALTSVAFLIAISAKSQNVGINTTGAAPNASSILDLNTGNAGTMGLLPEQVALTATNAAGPIVLPATGLIVYNTATAGVSPNNVTPGYYFNAGTPGAPNWAQFVAGNSATTTSGGWLLNGNTGTNPATNFLGTTDANAVNFRTTNLQRMTITAAGLVGINVMPGALLDVEGNAAGGAIGLFVNSNNTGIALAALNNAGLGASNGIGVLANSLQSGGSAVAAQLCNAVTTYYPGVAVSGTSNTTVAGGKGGEFICNNATGIGAFASTTGTGGIGLYGQTGATGVQPGVFGYNTTVASGTGVIGTGNGLGSINGLGVGSGGAFAGSLVGVYCQYTQVSQGGVGGVFQDGFSGGQADVNAWNGGTHYKIICSYVGSVSCAVPNLNDQMVVMHCPETPEFYFEDYGEGQLVNGRAHITIDPVVAKNVAIIPNKHPLRVFIQLDNDSTCKGVVVANKTLSGFDVIELNGGNSNAPFEWHIICNVKDQPVNGSINHMQDLRMEPAPVPFTSAQTPIPVQAPPVYHH